MKTVLSILYDEGWNARAWIYSYDGSGFQVVVERKAAQSEDWQLAYESQIFDDLETASFDAVNSFSKL